jgi:hypothetical protein
MKHQVGWTTNGELCSVIDLKSSFENDENMASGSSSAPSIFYWKIFPLVLLAALLPWTVTLKGW